MFDCSASKVEVHNNLVLLDETLVNYIINVFKRDSFETFEVNQKDQLHVEFL